MGNNVGHQQFWLTGSRVYFQRDPINAVEQPIFDMGRVEPISPGIETEMVQLEDSDGGVRRVVVEELSKISESYECRFSNLSPDMAQYLFAANPPTGITQTAVAIGPLAHWAVPGRLVKLRNASGALMYGIASVASVSALVQGTDWEVYSLERGLIRMIPGGGFTVAGNVNITYTPRAIPSTELRLLNPQTAASIQGTGLIVWSRKGNTHQTVREARFSLTATGAAFADNAFSSGTVRLAVLSDPTQAIPAGRLFYWLGQLPTTS